MVLCNNWSHQLRQLNFQSKCPVQIENISKQFSTINHDGDLERKEQFSTLEWTLHSCNWDLFIVSSDNKPLNAEGFINNIPVSFSCHFVHCKSHYFRNEWTHRRHFYDVLATAFLPFSIHPPPAVWFGKLEGSGSKRRPPVHCHPMESSIGKDHR